MTTAATTAVSANTPATASRVMGAGATFSRSQLATLETPQPSYRTLNDGTLSISHQPVGHYQLVDMVDTQLAQRGLQIKEESFLIDKHSRMFGILNIDRHQDGVQFSLGVRNSHNKDMSASMLVGSKVLVCSNMCFQGHDIIARKHTQQILVELPDLISSLLDTYDDREARQLEFFSSWKNKQIGEHEAAWLILSAAESGAYPATHASRVWETYNSAEHAEMHGRSTAWSVLNAATQAAKLRKNQMLAFEDSANLYQFFENQYPLEANHTISVPNNN